MYSKDDFIREANTQLSAYEEQRANLNKLIQENEQHSSEIKEQIQSAHANLVELIIPSLTKENLESLASLIKAPRVATLWDSMGEVEQKLLNIIEELENDDDFRKREALIEPRTGVLTSQLEELEPMYGMLMNELAEMESIPGMKRLIDSGYGTSRYPHTGLTKYLNWEYLNDWKNADIVTEQLKAASFADVASRHSELTHQVSTFGESITSLRSQIEILQKKATIYDKAILQKQDLITTLQAEVGREIVLFLQSGGEKAAAKLKNGSEALKLVSHIDGMNLKLEYLQKLNVAINGDINDLNLMAGKLLVEKKNSERDTNRRTANPFTREQFANRFKNNNYDKRYNSYRSMGRTIYTTNDYSGFSLIEDMLLVGGMAAGLSLLDGNGINETDNYSFYQANSYGTDASHSDTNFENNQYSASEQPETYDRTPSSNDSGAAVSTASWSDAS